MRSRLTATRRPVAMAAAAAITAVLCVTATAMAYHAEAGGNVYAYQTVWVGQGYHGIVRVSAWSPGVRESMCGKAQMQDGQHKGGGGCDTNTNKRESVFVNYSPYSAGYGYYGGAGGSTAFVRVYECGIADAPYCDI